MRAETIPLVLGIIMLVISAALIADAIIADQGAHTSERRSRERPERSKIGQIVFGLATLLVAAALLGRDQWRFTTLAIAAAVVLAVIGVGLNIRYIRGSLLGPVLGRSAKRRETDSAVPENKSRRR